MKTTRVALTSQQSVEGEVRQQQMAEYAAQCRARRRAVGMRSTEAVLHESEIALLDSIKERLGLGSRSEVIRVLIGKVDLGTLTSADVAILQRSAA